MAIARSRSKVRAVYLRSRRDNDFSRQYPGVVRGFAKLPADTVIHGEVVALDEHGRPSFNLLQNYGSAATPVVYYVFDALVVNRRDVRHEPLTVRRELLEQQIVPKLAEPVRYMAPLDAPLEVLIRSVREQGFEGLVAKRRDSRYESGERSGAWLYAGRTRNGFTPAVRAQLAKKFRGLESSDCPFADLPRSDPAAGNRD